jgi:hypothetical protein
MTPANLLHELGVSLQMARSGYITPQAAIEGKKAVSEMCKSMEKRLLDLAKRSGFENIQPIKEIVADMELLKAISYAFDLYDDKGAFRPSKRKAA